MEKSLNSIAVAKAKARREARLAAELRANLKRRKDQARLRSDEPAASGPPDSNRSEREG